jgi:hypothetical protein
MEISSDKLSEIVKKACLEAIEEYEIKKREEEQRIILTRIRAQLLRAEEMQKIYSLREVKNTCAI